MSTERTKILEMLSEGKITVDEATKLLQALGTPGQDEDEPEDRDGRRRRKSRRRARASKDGVEVDIDLDGFEQEIHDRISDARETLKASMPRIKKAVRDSMPEIDRAVREATGSIPDIGRIVKDAL